MSDDRKSLAIAYAMKKRAKKMAEGGMAEEEMESGYEPMPDPMAEDTDGDMDDDMVTRLMAKKYSKGGRVANSDELTADFMPNEFDELHLADDLESSETEANSGDDLGDDREDDDRKDIVRRMMASRAKRDRMPRPA